MCTVYCSVSCYTVVVLVLDEKRWMMLFGARVITPCWYDGDLLTRVCMTVNSGILWSSGMSLSSSVIEVHTALSFSPGCWEAEACESKVLCVTAHI